MRVDPDKHHIVLEAKPAADLLRSYRTYFQKDPASLPVSLGEGAAPELPPSSSFQSASRVE
jgi:hypothetical protein